MLVAITQKSQKERIQLWIGVKMSNYLDTLKQTISSPGKQSAQNWVKIRILFYHHSLTLTDLNDISDFASYRSQ